MCKLDDFEYWILILRVFEMSEVLFKLQITRAREVGISYAYLNTPVRVPGKVSACYQERLSMHSVYVCENLWGSIRYICINSSVLNFHSVSCSQYIAWIRVRLDFVLVHASLTLVEMHILGVIGSWIYCMNMLRALNTHLLFSYYPCHGPSSVCSDIFLR